MPYLLNVIYLLVLLLASPWLLWQAWRKGKYRAGFAEKFLGRVPIRSGDRPCVWLHAVSVGEVNLLAVLIKEFERRRPDCECVISTTSVAGYQLAQKKYPRHSVFYCPLDFSWAVRAALRRVRPALLVLAELELWPNLIRAAGETGAKVAIVNGRLSDNSFRGYRRLRPFVASLLRRVDCLAAQNDECALRFLELGAKPDAVQVTGSLKFDGANTDRDNPATRRLRELAGIAETDLVFLAGSTQDPEETLALETFRSLSVDHPRLRLILVPRHPERFDEVARLLETSGLAWCRRSELEPRSHNVGQATGLTASAKTDTHGANHCQASGLTYSGDTLLPKSATWQVLIVDTVGELGAWWGTAAIAFVGGSLGTRGGQNMIEPAAYGAAVCYGPNTRNFRDIVAAMLQAEAAQVIHDGTELTAFVRRCLADPQFAAELGLRARRLVSANLGATAKTVDLLEALLALESKATQRRAA